MGRLGTLSIIWHPRLMRMKIKWWLRWGTETLRDSVTERIKKILYVGGMTKGELLVFGRMMMV